MNCGREDCTEVHDTSRPMIDQCPGARTHHLKRMREFRARHATNPEWVERERERKREWRATSDGFDERIQRTRKDRAVRIAERLEDLHG